jgi:hypothetical protein
MTTTEQVQPNIETSNNNNKTPQTIQNEFTTKLVQQSNSTAYNNLAKLIGTDEYSDNSVTYRAKILTHKEIGQIKKLTRQSDEIDQEKDWDKYIENLRAQGKLLIQDLTDEQFDAADWYILENLIVAWRMKPRGFRSL